MSVSELRRYLEANNGLRGLEILEPGDVERAVALFRRDGFAVVGGVLSGPFQCDGGVRQEIVEGSSNIVPSNGWNDEFSTDPNSESTNVADVELRAFVVEGTAPFFVEDCNQDGRVTVADAACMGFGILSNEVEFNFKQMGNQNFPCFPNFALPWSVEGTNEVLVDFDASGPPQSLVCPTGGCEGIGMGNITNCILPIECNRFFSLLDCFFIATIGV